MTAEKALFIQEPFFSLLQKLSAEAVPKWGKMNPQEMVEHLSAIFDVSSGKLHFDLVTPEEYLPKYKEFLYSDKQFRENTKAPANIIGEEPLPLQYDDLDMAKEKLREAVNNFFTYFKNNPRAKTVHPSFGALDFDEWILLHHKHVTHHLKQYTLLE